MNAFTIKDIENLSGIKAHTIRIWEQRYSFLNPQRTETNIRFYSNHELQTVLNIALLNKYGYKISHIDRMSQAEITEKVLTLTQAEAQQERIVNELLHAMVEVDMDSFEKILDNYIGTKGIEKAILQIIFPFLERIGILWLTNHIKPAQEHLVSNIVRQKLVMGIESLPVRHGNKSAILYLPEGEHHEMGLLYLHYLLKKKGVRVWYLGANCPLSDMAFLAQLKMPDFLYLHLTSVAANFNLEKYLNALHQKLPDMPTIVSGVLTIGYKKKLPASVTLKQSLAEVMSFVSEL